MDYTDAGFDDFLSRSIDSTPQTTLDTGGPVSNQVAYDRTQVSGMLGDSLQLGNIRLAQNAISIKNSNNTTLLIGEQTDGTTAVTVAKEGKDADINRPADLVFNSNQNVFKIAKSDSYTFPGIASIAGGNFQTQFIAIPHNLGFVPGYQCYAKIFNGDVVGVGAFPAYYYAEMGHVINFWEAGTNPIADTIYTGIDTDFLYFGRQITNPDVTAKAAAPLDIKYYIFQDSVAI